MKDSKTTPREKELALMLISDVVRDACSGSQRPSARELKNIARSAGAALAAGIKKFNAAI